MGKCFLEHKRGRVFLSFTILQEHRCYGMSGSPKNPCKEALTPIGMVSAGGAFGRSLGLREAMKVDNPPAPNP